MMSCGDEKTEMHSVQPRTDGSHSIQENESRNRVGKFPHKEEFWNQPLLFPRSSINYNDNCSHQTLRLMIQRSGRGMCVDALFGEKSRS